MKIWSVNRISHEKYFSWKVIHRMSWTSQSQTLLWKLKIENISGSTVWNSYYKVCFIVSLIWGLPKFITLYCIDWPSLIAWLSLLHEILGNMCIIIICYPVCDVINFEIKHSFLIKLFFYIIKKSGWKCKYLKNKKSF